MIINKYKIDYSDDIGLEEKYKINKNMPINF